MKRTIAHLLLLVTLFSVAVSMVGCSGGSGAQVDENALQKEQQEREKFNKENGVQSGF